MKTPLCGRWRHSEMGGRQKTAVLKTPPPAPASAPGKALCLCLQTPHCHTPYSQFMNVAWGSSREETYPSTKQVCGGVGISTQL